MQVKLAPEALGAYYWRARLGGVGLGGGGRPKCGEPGHLHCCVSEGRCDDLRAGSCAWILVTWVTKLLTGSLPLYSGIWRIQSLPLVTLGLGLRTTLLLIL